LADRADLITHKTDSARSNTHAYLVVVAAILAISVSPTFIRLAQSYGLPSLLIACGRLLLSALILTPLVYQRYRDDLRRIDRGDLLLAAVAGFWISMHFITLVISLEHTSILVAQVLISSSPLWVALMETYFLKARLPRIVWIGLVLTLAGCAVIGLSGLNQQAAMDASAEGGNPTLGVMLGLACAFASAIYMTIGRKVRAKVANVPYLWMVFGFGALTGLATLLFAGTQTTGYPVEGYFWLVMVTLLPQLVGHSGFNYALAFIPATLVSIAAQGITILAAIVAYFVFAEVPTWLEAAGSAVIIIGVSVAILGQHSRRFPLRR
jgi:drug/metabolite transporter (DMT)-like permease